MTARDADGAPIFGGVSDPAHTSGPGYTPTWIATCPECGCDLIDEAWYFWCASCRKSVSFAEVAYFDETDHERD